MYDCPQNFEVTIEYKDPELTLVWRQPGEKAREQVRLHTGERVGEEAEPARPRNLSAATSRLLDAEPGTVRGSSCSSPPPTHVISPARVGEPFGGGRTGNGGHSRHCGLRAVHSVAPKSICAWV